MSTFTLGIVADDVTGASDTAVQFARRGWTSLLLLDPAGVVIPKAASHSVLALTTDSRALANDVARRLTSDAVAQLIAAGVDRIYLKIDSTMRGSIPGQIAGALDAWRRKHPNAVAIVCPAYPQMGRTVVGNRLLVGGEAVERTAIGRDPVTPVTTSDLATLIPNSNYLTADRLADRSADVVTLDAGSTADLTRLASAIEAIGASAIPVGSAGLADVMAALWGGTQEAVRGVPLQPDRGRDAPAVRSVRLQPDLRRIIIQVTSLNPVSHAQVAKLSEVRPDTVILTGRAEDVAPVLAGRLAGERWDLLGLIGGDGARAAMHLLGASGIRILDSIVEGIPLGVIVGGKADGMPVFTKAGGFGDESALVRLIEGLTT